MFHSVVDFVSNVDVNTARAEGILLEGNSVRDGAELEYLAGENEAAKEGTDEAPCIVAEAKEEATAAKDGRSSASTSRDGPPPQRLPWSQASSCGRS